MSNQEILTLLNLKKEDIDEFLSAVLISDDEYISILTRSGGSNRTRCYESNERLRQHELNVSDEDVDDGVCLAQFIFLNPQKKKV